MRKFSLTNNTFFTYLVFYIYTTSEIMQAVPQINNIVNFFRMIVFFLFAWNYIVGKKNIYINALILWQIAVILSCAVNNTISTSSFFNTINVLTIALFVKENIDKNKIGFLRCGRNWFAILLFCNLIHLIFFSPYKGVNGNVYILGLRVSFTMYCYAAVVFSIAKDYLYSQQHRISVNSILILILAIANMAIPMVATGIIGLIAIYFAYIVLINERSFWYLIAIALIATYCIILQNDIIQIFAPFLNLFGKDVTFTARNYIWKQAIELIKLKPILGYGTPNFPVSYFGGVERPAHNEILHSLYSGGIVSILPISLAIFVTAKKCFGKSKWNRFCMAFVFGLCMVMVTEIITVQNSLFFILSLFYFLSDWERKYCYDTNF